MCPRISEDRSNWISAPLAPRFERKAAAAAAAAENGGQNGGGGGGQRFRHHSNNSHYIDADGFELEKLPDGFTKIRSKNLDVLFKRDYYAQRADGSVVMTGMTSDGGCSSSSGVGEDVGDEDKDEEEVELVGNSIDFFLFWAYFGCFFEPEV